MIEDKLISAGFDHFSTYYYKKGRFVVLVRYIRGISDYSCYVELLNLLKINVL